VCTFYTGAREFFGHDNGSSIPKERFGILTDDESVTLLGNYTVVMMVMMIMMMSAL